MGRSSKRTAADDGRRSSKRQKKPVVTVTTTGDDTNEHVSSSDQQSSDSDDSYINEEDVNQFAKTVKDYGQKLTENRKQAKEFEDRVQARTANILATIEQHRQRLEHGRNAYNTGLLAVIPTLLQPTSIEVGDTEMQRSDKPNTTLSLTFNTNGSMRTYADRLYENVNATMATYSELASHEFGELKIQKMKDDMANDSRLTMDVLAAGRKNYRTQLQDKLGGGIYVIQEKMKLTDEEEKLAAVFQKCEPLLTEEATPDRKGWAKYLHTLTRIVGKAEQITEHT